MFAARRTLRVHSRPHQKLKASAQRRSRVMAARYPAVGRTNLPGARSWAKPRELIPGMSNLER
jgi:hypothetical protein